VSPKPKLIREVRGGRVVYTPLAQTANVRRRRVGAQALSVGLLLGAAGVVVGVGWLAYQAIANPDFGFALNQALPTGTRNSTSEGTPQTLNQIQSNLQTGGQTAGQRLILSANRDSLIPVLGSAKDCSAPCPPQITELRLYRSLEILPLFQMLLGQRYFQLQERLAIANFEFDRLQEADLALLDQLLSPPPLPMTEIQPYSQKLPTPGTWLRLSGVLNQSKGQISYGQIWYFNPDQSRLQMVLNWSSPSGATPEWRQVTGSPTPELVSDRSIGLEPAFAIYQLQFNRSEPRSSVRLQALNSEQPALPAFKPAVNLAKAGLWSPALSLMQQVRPQSAAAQAQIDYVAWHAQISRTQAEQATGNERIVALLMNGDWTAALQAFPVSGPEQAQLRGLLQTDPGGLRRRVEAALAVKPNQPNAIAWGAMIIFSQSGRSAANAWLSKQTNTSSKVQTLLQQLDQANSPLSTQP
jgi:hypothetical protein